jgi:hypothetical protein
MTCRSAILIDNFLEQSKFDALSEKVSSSPEYYTTTVQDVRDALFQEAYGLVFERLKEIGLYQTHYADSVKLFGYNQFRPANEGYGNFNGPHFDHGGYVFYIHPHWDESWEGKIKFTNANEDQYKNGIYAKPNRFIWIEPGTYHDVSTTASNTTHARVANIAFLGGNINIDPVETTFINIVTAS